MEYISPYQIRHNKNQRFRPLIIRHRCQAWNQPQNNHRQSKRTKLELQIQKIHVLT